MSDLKLKLSPRYPGRLADGTIFELWGLGEISFYIKESSILRSFIMQFFLQIPVILGFPWWVKNQVQMDYIGLPDDQTSLLSSLLLNYDENKPYPPFLVPYDEVFDEELGRRLTPQRECVMKIVLIEGTPLPKAKAYLLSRSGMQLVKE